MRRLIPLYGGRRSRPKNNDDPHNRTAKCRLPRAVREVNYVSSGEASAYEPTELRAWASATASGSHIAAKLHVPIIIAPVSGLYVTLESFGSGSPSGVTSGGASGVTSGLTS